MSKQNLTIQSLRRGALFAAGCGSLLLAHTVAVHAYAESLSPTSARFDFWTRVDIRRAYMLEKFQHKLSGAEQLLTSAIRNEVMLGRYVSWQRDYLQLFFKLVQTKVEQMKLREAIISYDALLQELNGKLDAELQDALGWTSDDCSAEVQPTPATVDEARHNDGIPWQLASLPRLVQAPLNTIRDQLVNRVDLRKLAELIVLVQLQIAKLQLAIGDENASEERARHVLNLSNTVLPLFREYRILSVTESVETPVLTVDFESHEPTRYSLQASIAVADTFSARKQYDEALLWYSQALKLANWHPLLPNSQRIFDQQATNLLISPSSDKEDVSITPLQTSNNYLEVGWPQLPALQCQRAISLFHIGNLHYLQYSAMMTGEKDTSFNHYFGWFKWRPWQTQRSKNNATLPSALGWLEAALREALLVQSSNQAALLMDSSTSPESALPSDQSLNAIDSIEATLDTNMTLVHPSERACVECAAAVFLKLGSIYVDHGDEKHARTMYQRSNRLARDIEDVVTEEQCIRALANLTLADEGVHHSPISPGL